MGAADHFSYWLCPQYRRGLIPLDMLCRCVPELRTLLSVMGRCLDTYISGPVVQLTGE